MGKIHPEDENKQIKNSRKPWYVVNVFLLGRLQCTRTSLTPSPFDIPRSQPAGPSTQGYSMLGKLNPSLKNGTPSSQAVGAHGVRQGLSLTPRGIRRHEDPRGTRNHAFWPSHLPGSHGKI